MNEKYVIFQEYNQLEDYLNSKLDTEDKLIHLYCLESLLQKWTKQEILKAAMEENILVKDILIPNFLTDCNCTMLNWHQQKTGNVSCGSLWKQYNGSHESSENQRRIKKNLPLLPEFTSITYKPHHDGAKTILNNLFKKQGLILWRVQTHFIDSYFMEKIIKLTEFIEFQNLIKRGYIGFVTCNSVTMVTQEQMKEFQNGCALGKWEQLCDEKVYKKGSPVYYCDAKRYFNLFDFQPCNNA